MLVEWLGGRFFVFLFVCLPACFFIYDSMIERSCGWYTVRMMYVCIYAYPIITHDCISVLYDSLICFGLVKRSNFKYYVVQSRMLLSMNIKFYVNATERTIFEELSSFPKFLTHYSSPTLYLSKSVKIMLIRPELTNLCYMGNGAAGPKIAYFKNQ